MRVGSDTSPQARVLGSLDLIVRLSVLLGRHLAPLGAPVSFRLMGNAKGPELQPPIEKGQVLTPVGNVVTLMVGKHGTSLEA